MKRPLAEATWTQIPSRALVLVPVGSLEQHGPHLPLDTDTVIAEAVTRRVAELLIQRGESEGVVVAPAITYGASGEHQGFPGTTSIGTEVLTQVLVELTRSLSSWAGRVVFVNGHGGNVTALKAGVGQMVAEGHAVSWLPCVIEGADAHAGFTETSLILHLQPWSVRIERAEVGNSAPVGLLLPELMRGGVKAVSANGVLGDPTGATADAGKRILERVACDMYEHIVTGQGADTGPLRGVVGGTG